MNLIDSSLAGFFQSFDSKLLNENFSFTFIFRLAFWLQVDKLLESGAFSLELLPPNFRCSKNFLAKRLTIGNCGNGRLAINESIQIKYSNGGFIYLPASWTRETRHSIDCSGLIRIAGEESVDLKRDTYLRNRLVTSLGSILGSSQIREVLVHNSAASMCGECSVTLLMCRIQLPVLHICCPQGRTLGSVNAFCQHEVSVSIPIDSELCRNSDPINLINRFTWKLFQKTLNMLKQRIPGKCFQNAQS